MAQYDVTLRDYWRIIRKRKLYIIFAMLMLGLTSFATAQFSRPAPRYRAESKVQYERSQSAEQAYAFAMGGSDDLETQQQVIKGYDLVERIAQRLGIVDTVTATDEQRIQAILSLRPSLVTSVEGLTNIITITITSGDRFYAQELANIASEEYEQYNYEVRNASLLKTQKIIKSRRDTVIARLSRAQDELRKFQEETQIISINAATSTVLGALRRAQENHARLELLHNNIDRLLQTGEEIEEHQLQTIPREEGGNRFSGLLSELQSLNQERNRLLVTFTEMHPEIKKLDNRKQVIIVFMLEALRVQREVVKKQLDQQAAEVAKLDKRFRELPATGIELEELYRNVGIQSSLLESIENEYQLSQIAEAEEIREVTILQRALLPRAPINPSTPTTVAGVGALLGLIIGVVAAFIAETLDTSIGTIEDVEEYLEVPVVGIVPQMDLESMREALEARTGGPVDTEFVERHLRLSTHFEPQSTMAESYRALRTNIQFANLEKGAKVLCITSSSHQEGKSTTSANLAVTLAQAGNRVLLVDGDLRRPTIARIFGLDREPGITDVILGNYTWREVVRTVTDIMVGGLGLDDIMMTAGMDNLNIITSGVLPPNPAEITDSRRMTEFLQEVKAAYDVVIVDAPPVLQATDATVLGTKVDGVLIVYRIGNVSRSALKRAKQQLDTVGVSTLGVVINGLRADISEDFKDLRYYSYYTYGTSQEEETGPYFTRLYNRSKRQLDTHWNTIKTQTEPFINFAKEKLPLDRLFSREETEYEEDEVDSLADKVFPIAFWIFLALFLAAGLAWQLGFITPNRPNTEPTTLPATSPPEEQLQQEEEALPPETPKTEDASPAKDVQTKEAPSDGATPVPETPGSHSHNNTAQPLRVTNQKLSSKIAPKKTTPSTTIERSSVHTIVDTKIYGIHVSSHKVKASALRDVKRYQQLGYKTKIIHTSVPNRGMFFRVIVGEYNGHSNASRALQQLTLQASLSYASISELPNQTRTYLAQNALSVPPPASPNTPSN